MTTLHTLSYDTCFHSFSFEGFPIHLKEYSKGLTDIPLVFIGGAFQNISQVEKLSMALAKESWVIVIDTPGNGDTGVLPHTFSFEFICRAIHFGLKRLGVDVINLLGCSYGSIIAMRYAQMYLGVEKLILASAMEKLPDALVYEFNLLLFQLEWNRMEEFAAGFTNLMTNLDLRESNKLCRITAGKLENALLNATTGIKEQFRHNTLRILRDGKTDLSLMPDVDATVFTGEHDHFVPVAANQRVADSFRRGRFIAVPDADHMIHVEKFRTMIDIVLGAVRGDLDAEPVKQAA
ncbi:alpha/beta fold hydrolase [Kordiimonas aestuarii]|uniref:alpha/beta fold hydrolase n=1 Tax=Kordiimonas aestuarii TaxID=1005925 RepID=UPI0021D0006C|nr:alpha/beta hydrolase [Kordiimonas aestuarii]